MKVLESVSVLVLLASILVSGATAKVPEFAFEDPAEDVTRNGDPYSGPVADANDILAASLREDADDLIFKLEMRDLSALSDQFLNLDFHAQYALSFQTHPDHEGYSMRALFGGVMYTNNPLGAWRYQVHDQEANTWTDADGRQVGSALEWTIPKGSYGFSDGVELSAWDSAAWFSYGDGTQSNDWTETDLLYVIGLGPVDPTAVDPSEVAPLPAGVAFAFQDEAQDVTSGGDPESGADANTTDVVAARLSEAGTDLFFELEMVDLSALPAQLYDPGFHAQYALSFVARAGHEGYSMRASFGGERYTGEAGGAWTFQIHDKELDEWPEAVGRVEGSTLIWTVPRADLRVGTGDTLTEWMVQTWNSYESRDQYGDWAETPRSHTLGEPAVAAAGGAPAAAHGNLEDDMRPVELPALPLFLALAAAALAARRRA